jgi:serine/threonine protein kinase
MPLVNCPLEVETTNCTPQEEDENELKNSNPKRIIQLFYDQK